MDTPLLSPAPVRLTPREGACVLPRSATLEVPAGLPGWFDGALDRFTTRLRAVSDCEMAGTEPGPSPFLRLVLGDGPAGAPAQVRDESYRIDVAQGAITVASPAAAGLRHGLETLLQLASGAGQARALPCLVIEDWPAFPVRGMMLDVSRCKVPTRQSLLQLLDLLAAFKFNHVELYTEHTFAFAGHDLVWGDASPIRPAEIPDLEAAASARGIELSPNFNSFGHWERWLRHPEYRRYAECPDGFSREDGRTSPWGTTLRPEPVSLRLLEELYADFLPRFASPRFNAGCDETWELGRGASRERAGQVGRTGVWTEFVSGIHGLASRHGKRLHVWADMLMKGGDHDGAGDAAAVAALPQDVVGLIWGYEAGHPFASQLEAFRATGRDAWVCPGTSSWNSIGGRLGNALANLGQAAAQGLAHGAEGYLITDWGDGGHHQFPFVSTPALVAGASASWAGSVDEASLADVLNRFVFDDPTGNTGRFVLELGRVPDLFAWKKHNRSTVTELLYARQEDLPAVAANFKLGELARAGAKLLQMELSLADIQPRGPDAALLRRECWLANRFLIHAVRRGIAHHTNTRVEDAFRRKEMTCLIAEFEELWLARNRPGGLHESSRRFRDLLATYPAPVVT